MGAIQGSLNQLAGTIMGGAAIGKHLENQEVQAKETHANTEQIEKITKNFETPKDEKGNLMTAQGFMQNAQNSKGPSLNELTAAMKAASQLSVSQLGKTEMNNRIKATRVNIKTRKGGKN